MCLWCFVLVCVWCAFSTEICLSILWLLLVKLSINKWREKKNGRMSHACLIYTRYDISVSYSTNHDDWWLFDTVVFIRWRYFQIAAKIHPDGGQGTKRPMQSDSSGINWPFYTLFLVKSIRRTYRELIFLLVFFFLALSLSLSVCSLLWSPICYIQNPMLRNSTQSSWIVLPIRTTCSKLSNK